MGFNRHFPRVVILGPARYQGKQLDDYATFQYTSHLVRFVGYIRQGLTMGNMLRVQMDQYQQIIGTEKHFLTLESTKYAYGERSRIKFLWDQNTLNGVTIFVHGAWHEKLVRENDVFIMDKLTEASRSVLTLGKLNAVRLWLKVSRLSDMVNVSGDKIEDWALYGPPRQSDIEWPTRRKPVAENLRLWRDTIRRVFCGGKGLYPRNLGPVIVHPDGRNIVEKAKSFSDILSSYPNRFKNILGPNLIGDHQVVKIIQILKEGQLYAGSDGSVKDEKGSHAYGFTSGREKEVIFGGAAMTPGSQEEMSSLRAEHCGAISILLILYAIQIHMGNDRVSSTYEVDIWIDNAEVLSRGQNTGYKDGIKGHLVLDYDMWSIMNMLQKKIVFTLRWNKVDSHIEDRIYAEGTKPSGDEFSIRLNEVMDKWAETARGGTDTPPQSWHAESQVMVRLDSGRLLYGDIAGQMKYEISKRGVVQHLMSKNLHWDNKIFNMIAWKGMESALGKMKDTEVTNVIKMAHGWQHDGYQKFLFNDDGDTYECPAGCGEQEGRLHFVMCTAAAMRKSQQQRLDEFKKVQKGLKTAGVIYHSLLRILQYLREGGDPPSFVNYFESPMDNLVKEAWAEQRLIGWDQILKGRLSSKWGKAQGMFYGINHHTRHEKHFTEQVWVAKVIASLLRFTLGLWNDRCEVLHGANLEERQKIKRDQILGKLTNCFAARETIPECYRYIFKDSYEELGRKSTQYLVKWVSTFKLLQKQGGQAGHAGKDKEQAADRRGRRAKNKQIGMNMTRSLRSNSQAHRERMNERVTDGPSNGAVGSDG